MTPPDPIELAVVLGRILDRLGVRYCIGGSVASSVYGEVRTTLDVDVVVNLQTHQVGPFVAATEADFHVLEESVHRAVRERSSFNVIHEGMLIKADFYVSSDDPLHRAQFARARRVALRPGTDSEVEMASPEDVVIHKLRWYRMGGDVSDRQWRDVLGVLKVQGARLERDYMDALARQLQLSELLARAIEEAGLK